MTDESWPMIEEAVFRLFDELPHSHVAIGSQLAELGYEDIESEYPIEACRLIFRAQGRSLTQTDALDRVVLAELAAVVGETADAVVYPPVSAGAMPVSTPEHVTGIVVGELRGRVVVPLRGEGESVSLVVTEADQLTGSRADTFDPSAVWTKVTGSISGPHHEAGLKWGLAMAAAHRAIATELVELADQALRLAVEFAGTRVQFGAPVGSFQALRHSLADAASTLAGARALLAESWQFGGNDMARAAKIAAGRAHRVVSGIAMQTMAAIGLTAEHDLHRFVRRGFQIEALIGSYNKLENDFADAIFADSGALPTLITCS